MRAANPLSTLLLTTNRRLISPLCPAFYSRTPVVTSSLFARSRNSSSSTMSPTMPDAGWDLDKSSRFSIYSAQPLEKSDNDERAYRLIRLQNQMQVLLVHDGDTDKASAALDVHVGHLSDPSNLQGLAHFLEHLLFMGTEKYPKENDYNQFLSEHSGHSNAFTSLENTNYYFEVEHSSLEGALDRFSQFFISPLFNPSGTERELKAVDSEHKKNLQLDNWRTFQLEKSLSNPNHPYSNFGTGNIETLRDAPKRAGLDVRAELIKFHDRYYSANIMRLCVLGRESLDKLTEWAVDKFEAVKNKQLDPPSFPGHPLTETQLMKQIFVKPVKDIRSLELCFPFPDQYPLYESQPGRYLSHLIGHEGKGSVLSLLKKQGWANYLQVGASHGGIGFEFFKVDVDLTEDGLAHYEDVVTIIFQYIAMLKDHGIQENLFREVQSLASLAFRFKEKSPSSQYTSRLAGVMQRCYRPHEILSGASLIREYNPKLITESLGWLREDAFRLTLISQTFPGGHQATSKERWYGTEYTVLDISDSLKHSLRNLTPHPQLYLPGPNDFIPHDFEINKREIVKPLSQPQLVMHTPTIRLWHKKDDTFWIPRANMWILFRAPLTYATPANCVKTKLYADLLKDSLNEYSYDAEVAGLFYNFENQIEGMMLGIGGYNDKLAVLLEKVVSRMKDLIVDRERFGLIKDQLRRYYKNYALEPPYHHALYYISYITQEKMWTHEEKLRELEDIEADDITAFFPSILSHLHMEALVHGNVFKEDAVRMMQTVERILRPKPLLPSQLVSTRSLLLPKQGGQFVYRCLVPDPQNMNSAIEYYCQVGDVTQVPLRARLSLLAQIAQEPCFDQLRTKEQLGYLVFSGVRKQTGSMGLRLIIQSERDTIYLERRIESFLDRLRQIIEDMSESEYQAQVNSLISKKLEKDKNLGQEGGRYWAHVHSGYYEFDQVETDVVELRTITKKSLLEFFMTYVHPSVNTRKKLSVHMCSQCSPRKNRVNVGSLHTCITSAGYLLTVEDIDKAVGEGKGTVEESLRKLLIDSAHADELQIEGLMAKLVTQIQLDEQVDSTPSRTPTPEEDAFEDHDRLSEGNIFITDLIDFKARMELSAAAVPIINVFGGSQL